MPRPFEQFTRDGDERRISGIVLAQLGTDEQQGDVDTGFGLAQSRNPERNLDQLFEIVARIVAGSGRVRQFGEMLTHRIFNHRLIGRDDERGAGGEDEQPDGFERFDRRVRQAAVEIVDEDDQLLDTRLLEQIVKSFPECLDLFRHIFRLSWLQQTLHTVDRFVVILLRGEF